MILKTELHSRNRITAINTLAIPVITYCFNITDWNFSEVKRLDIKIWKMMTTHSIHHPKGDIHRLYLSRSNGDGGVEVCLNSSCLIKHQSWSFLILEFIRWLDAATSFKTWKRKRFILCCKRSSRICGWSRFRFWTEFDGEMKNTENAWKLKRTAKEKGKRAINTAWNSKPLHGQYPLWSQTTDVDLHNIHQWLRRVGLKAEAEEFIVAAQDQSLFSRNF